LAVLYFASAQGVIGGSSLLKAKLEYLLALAGGCNTQTPDRSVCGGGF